MNHTLKFSRLTIVVLCGIMSGCVTWNRNPSLEGSGLLGSNAGTTIPLPSDQFSPSVRGRDATPLTNEGNRSLANDEQPGRRVPARSTYTQQSPHNDNIEPTSAASLKPTDSETVIRGQSPDFEPLGDSDYGRSPLPVSGPTGGQQEGTRTADSRYDSVRPAQYAPPVNDPYGVAPPSSYGAPTDVGPSGSYPPSGGYAPNYGGPAGYGAPPPGYGSSGPPRGYGGNVPPPGSIGYGNSASVRGPEFPAGPTDMLGPQPYTGRLADLIVNVREQQTGRFMFGVGVNSDAGLTAQVVVDEYNFDWRRFPRGVEDIVNGTAWRGGGQRLRIEAIPGSELQRYMINFTEPYLMDTNISLNLSAYLFDRQYFDWDEQRLGGRVALGYRLTPDLSVTAGLRAENVNVNDPRVRGVAELEEVLGDSSLFSGRVSLTHDTRDSPFAATQGHYLELTYEQAFGSFDYPRGIVDYRRYFLLSERPDGSGRHTLGSSLQASFSGSQTPLYENFFAGGYSTIRGFRFRGAAPKSGDIFVGGEFSLLGSFEYMFPVTADDMLKGVVFCDYGTVEEEIQIEGDDFRVAVGAGLRISVPAMGPAPIAVDFAVPIAREDTDRIQNFSFFVGFGR